MTVAWVVEADKEYLAARLLLLGGSAISSKGTYHAATALEQILKGYLEGVVGIKKQGHDLQVLAVASQAGGDTFFSDPATLSGFDGFTRYQQLGRYGPNASAKSDPERIDTPTLKVFGKVEITPDTLQTLDRLFLTTRAKILIKRINGLKAIQDGQSNHLFVQGWVLPITSLAVLTAGNQYVHLID